MADLILTDPVWFLFDTDEVAPPDQKTYPGVYQQCALLSGTLSPAARLVITGGFTSDGLIRVIEIASTIQMGGSK